MLKMIRLSDLATRELETNKVVGSGGNADETVMDSFKLSKSQKIVKSPKHLKGLKSHKFHWLKRTKLPDL